MNRIKSVLKAQFGIECIDMSEIHDGLSAMNFCVKTRGQAFFLKIYDKKKPHSAQWIENISFYMPVLSWLNENTELRGRIASPLKTRGGGYRFDDDENVYLLFEYIEGTSVGKSMSRPQILEAAEIIACLHSLGCEIPFGTGKVKEDYSIPFHFSLEQLPVDVKAILQPYSENLLSKIDELQTLSGRIRHRDNKLVLCHTDAHGYNLMQSNRLILVDWEGLKLAPAEADLFMFSKKDYWDIFIGRYKELCPGFVLDDDILLFYILRRKLEDIWEFADGIAFGNLSAEQRRRDMGFLCACLNTLDDLCFEL